MVYLTSCDAKTVRHGGKHASDRYFNQEHFETNYRTRSLYDLQWDFHSSSKVMAQTVFFLMFLVTLTIDLYSTCNTK